MEEQKRGMTPAEMHSASQKKVQQITDLMEVLQVTCEAREHVSRDGFITKVVYWVDNEQYPVAEPEAITETSDEPAPKDS